MTVTSFEFLPHLLEYSQDELYDAIYKMGELILSRINEEGLSSAAARKQELDSKQPISAHHDSHRALNNQDSIDESCHQSSKSAVEFSEFLSDPHLDEASNRPTLDKANRRTQIRRDLGTDSLPRVVNYPRLSEHSLGLSMQPNMGSVASSVKIFASGDIEPPSPFDATGSALHDHYERIMHSSPLLERKVAGIPSSSFSQANIEAGTRIERRSPAVSGKFNQTLGAVDKNWGITYLGDKRTSVDNFLARLEEGRAVSFLSEEELMIASPFLLDGLALQWFRMNKSSWPTWDLFRATFRARFGDINYQWRLDEQVASRVQGEDELTADYLTCLQCLYQKFERPVSLIEQMDRAYMNMRPELKRAIRRHEFRDYDQLTTLATDVERMLETLRVERVPP